MNVLPLYPHDVFGFPTGLLLGTLIGFAFGFVLERAGFGNAKNLAAQFYLTDTRVLKVMFSAIATACAGIGLLAGFGVLDLSLLTVPETFIGPHVVGGLLLGIGFIVSGYCPGTGVVAMASGKWDGLMSIVGVMIGSLLFGFVYGPLEGFYKSGAMGSVTIAQALGLPFPVLAAGVVLMAVGCFLGAEKLETIFAPKANKPVPASQPAVRNRAFALMGVLAVVGLVSVALPARQTAVAEKPLARIGAVELAQKIVAVAAGALDPRPSRREGSPRDRADPGNGDAPRRDDRGAVRRHAPRHADARRLRAGRRAGPSRGSPRLPRRGPRPLRRLRRLEGRRPRHAPAPGRAHSRPHRGVPHEERPERLLHRSRGGPAAEARREGRRHLRRAEEGGRLLTS